MGFTFRTPEEMASGYYIVPWKANVDKEVRRIAELYGHKEWVQHIEYDIVKRFVACLIPDWWSELRNETDTAFLTNNLKYFEGPRYRESDLDALAKLPWESLKLIPKVEPHKDRRAPRLYPQGEGADLFAEIYP